MDRDLSLIEGCRGQGATDVLPHDARGVAVPPPVSRLVVVVRVVLTVTDGIAGLSFVLGEDLVERQTRPREMFA
ncbi:hypothetical protein ACS0PU_012134 [Formica fusca]